MPKRLISLLLLITLTLGPVSGVFGSVMDKINSYANSYVRSLYTKGLFFDVEDQKVANYALQVADSQIAQNTYGDYAITTFGAIGPDDANVIFRDEKGNITDQLQLVASPPEYYFTDMVFIQQKYEEALVDLYYYRAEGAWSRFPASDRRPNVDEAIAGTYWVAQQNGVTYSEEQIQEKFMEQLDAQLQPYIESYNDQKDGSITEIAKYTDDFVNALREYYLNPCLETFENTIQVAFDIEDKVDENWFEWRSFFLDIVADISEGLAISFLSHGRENKKAS